VLLLHGYPDCHDVWSEVWPRLALAHRVIAYDVRGAGASTRPAGDAGYDLQELADDAAAVIDAMSPGRPVHVVGHDWGAIQAWELVTTARADGRVASFTSISGPCLDHVGHWLRRPVGSRPIRRARGLVGQGLRSWYVAALQVPGAAAWVWPRLGPRWSRLRSLADGADAGPAATSVVDDGVAGAALYRRNVGVKLRGPREDAHARVPVQVIVPTRDRYVSPGLAVGAARPWVRDLTVRDIDAGHWAPRTHPEPIARAIAEHVSRAAGRRPRGVAAADAGRSAVDGGRGQDGGRRGAVSEIRTRRVSFELADVPVRWIPDDPFVGHLIDVLHLLLPAGERWFVDVYKDALPLVHDESLRADMRGFMGQEATHARAHDAVLDHLRDVGVPTEPFTRVVEQMFERVFGARPPVPVPPRLWLEMRLGGIAAVEHFTCVLGRWIVERSGALDAAGADARMMALLRWHGAEEIEHRSVAFDTLVAVSGPRAYLWRAVGLALAVPIMTVLWARGTQYFVRRDRSLKGWRFGYRDFVRAAGQRRVPGWELVTAIPRFLRPGYHPEHEALTEVARAYLALPRSAG
jgi:predicted metal-dependent hydrolase/pimeloyl-ACP methyl ester carboxylesterase